MVGGEHQDEEIARRSAIRGANSSFPCRIRSAVANSGTVTLTGTVRTLSERDEAERVVRNLAGVHCVVNQIAVEAPRVAEPTLHTAITQALARRAERVAVDVHGDTDLRRAPDLSRGARPARRAIAAYPRARAQVSRKQMRTAFRT